MHQGVAMHGGAARTLGVGEGGQADGALQAEREGVPIKRAEDLQELVQHLRAPVQFC